MISFWGGKRGYKKRIWLKKVKIGILEKDS